MALAKQARSVMRSLHLSSSYSSRNNPFQNSFGQTTGHSKFGDLHSYVDGALTKSTGMPYYPQNNIRLWTLKGYNHQINGKPWEMTSVLVYDSRYSVRGERSFSMHVKAPPQMRQGGGLKLCLASPGMVYEPYKSAEPISFLRRWFTRRGWKRSKEDLISEFKNAYAIAQLRKLTGYSKSKFYQEAIQLYKEYAGCHYHFIDIGQPLMMEDNIQLFKCEINSLLAQGDKTSLRKLVTENMYSIFKREIKQRETAWSSVYWEMAEPAIKVRTLRARMIGIDKNNLDNSFVQLTLEILTNQKFAAYDLQKNVVAGNMDAMVLVRDIWVFERALIQPGAKWRLCGRISL